MSKHTVEVFATDKRWIGGARTLGVPMFFWRLRHKNGNKLATSEAYTRKATARRVALRVALAGRFGFEDLTARKAKR